MEVRTERVDAIRAEERIRRDLGDLADLKASMSARGLINPITVSPDRRLIAGERRLESARQLGWPDIDVQVWRPADGTELLDVEAEENLCRKDLTPGEAELYRERRMGLEQEAAAERQRTLNRPGACSKLGQAKGKASHKASERTGYGHTSLDKVKEIRQIAADPDEPEAVRDEAQRQHDALMTGDTRIEPASQKVKKVRRQQQQLKGRLMPGAWTEGPQPAAVKTLTQRLLDVIKSGTGMAAVAVEIEGADLDLDNHTIGSLRKHLAAARSESLQLDRALRTVLDKRESNK